MHAGISLYQCSYLSDYFVERVESRLYFYTQRPLYKVWSLVLGRTNLLFIRLLQFVLDLWFSSKSTALFFSILSAVSFLFAARQLVDFAELAGRSVNSIYSIKFTWQWNNGLLIDISLWIHLWAPNVISAASYLQVLVSLYSSYTVLRAQYCWYSALRLRGTFEHLFFYLIQCLPCKKT